MIKIKLTVCLEPLVAPKLAQCSLTIYTKFCENPGLGIVNS